MKDCESIIKTSQEKRDDKIKDGRKGLESRKAKPEEEFESKKKKNRQRSTRERIKENNINILGGRRQELGKRQAYIESNEVEGDRLIHLE